MLDAKSWDVAEALFDMETDFGSEMFYSLEEDDIILIIEYMKWRSRVESINRGTQVWDKPVSAKLKEMASDWEFAGVCDYGYMGAETCIEGHPIRYAYNVHSPSLGITVPFGVKCVSDFFDVPQVKMSAYKRYFKIAQDELITCLNKGRYMHDRDYLENIDFITGLKNKDFEKVAKARLGIKGLELVLSFIYRGFHLPMYLKREIRNIERKFIAKFTTTLSNETSDRYRNSLFKIVNQLKIRAIGLDTSISESNKTPLCDIIKLYEVYDFVENIDIKKWTDYLDARHIHSFSELIYALSTGKASIHDFEDIAIRIYTGFALDNYKVWYTLLGVSNMNSVIDVIMEVL